MSDTSNLPPWPGAANAYALAGRITAEMARRGHVQIVRRGRRIVSSVPSTDLLDFIAALKEGDEETVKGLNIRFAEYDPARRTIP